MTQSTLHTAGLTPELACDFIRSLSYKHLSMKTMEEITVKNTIKAPAAKVWEVWTSPAHITKWNNPNADWHTPHAENDLRTGGKFLSRMEAKDGSMGFDFAGTYTEVVPHQHIAYTLDDGRKVKITLKESDGATELIEVFDPESQNPVDMQREGWQAILDSFKSYTENLK